jgi:uncharacterized protein YegP (UPF0339 family)
MKLWGKKREHDVVEVYQDVAGQYRWRRQSRNGRITSVSGEGYYNRADAERTAQQVNKPPYDLVQVLDPGSELE